MALVLCFLHFEIVALDFLARDVFRQAEPLRFVDFVGAIVGVREILCAFAFDFLILFIISKPA